MCLQKFIFAPPEFSGIRERENQKIENKQVVVAERFLEGLKRFHR